MSPDEYFARQEQRMIATSPALRKHTGFDVRAVSHTEAQALIEKHRFDAHFRVNGIGLYAGVRESKSQVDWGE